jgi:hypothetical protein
MQGEEERYFIHLCEQAAIERDTARLINLVREINDLLQRKRSQVSGSPESSGDPPKLSIGAAEP